MSPEEAEWIGRELSRFDRTEISPLVNLGSSTLVYRTVVCPEIDELIFAPLRKRGVEIYHVDLKAAEGVDIVGSLFDAQVQETIASISPRAILCNNLLEHIPERPQLTEHCERLLSSGGVLVVSAPFRYPFHPDPIDTGYRPSLEELCGEFHGLRFVKGDTVSFGTYTDQLRKKKWLVLRDLYLLATSLWGSDRRRVLIGNYSFIRRQYQVTCAILRKP